MAIWDTNVTSVSTDIETIEVSPSKKVAPQLPEPISWKMQSLILATAGSWESCPLLRYAAQS
jgi:hypothetical protein